MFCLWLLLLVDISHLMCLYFPLCFEIGFLLCIICEPTLTFSLQRISVHLLSAVWNQWLNKHLKQSMKTWRKRNTATELQWTGHTTYSVDFQAFPTSEQQYWIMLETCCSMVDISIGHFHDSTALVTTKPQFTVINTLICKQLRQVSIHCLAQKQPGYQKKHLDTKTFFLSEMMFLKKKKGTSCNKLYTRIEL